MKHTPRPLRWICLLLSMMLVLTSCGPTPNHQTTPVPETTSPVIETTAQAPETSIPVETIAPNEDDTPVVVTVPDEIIPEHSSLNYTDMVYERPDLDAVYANLEDALEMTGQDGVQDPLFTLYDTILQQLDHVGTMKSLASLKNSIDLSDQFYEEEMLLLDAETTKMDNDINEVTGAILASPYADAFTAKYGEEFVHNYEVMSKLNSPEIEALVEQESQLVADYNKLLSKEYSVEYKGQTVTISDLDFSDPNVATPYYSIYQQKNKECGEIYRQLVKIRVQIAKTLGYDNYTDYAYDCLGRDFTKEDAAQFAALVKRYIAPLSQELASAYNSKLASVQYASVPTMEEGLTYLRAALEAEFPAAMIQALDYMLDRGLYLFDDDPNMMPAGFSTILTEYAAPFLFINTSVYTDPSTLFHEFGHYYNFFLMGDVNWYDSNNLDLAEIHSQGLELLMFQYYEEIYGKQYAEALQLMMLSNLLDTILMGCCEDEFQQKVFEDPDMSLNDMNYIHAQLYEQYMGYPVYYEWVDIHHHFETPFYYISYATSAASSFEIWKLAQTDRPAALTAYRSITQNTVNSGYRQPLKRAGLSDPFTSDMVAQLAQTVRSRYLND